MTRAMYSSIATLKVVKTTKSFRFYGSQPASLPEDRAQSPRTSWRLFVAMDIFKRTCSDTHGVLTNDAAVAGKRKMHCIEGRVY